MTVADSITVAHNEKPAPVGAGAGLYLTKRCLGKANWEVASPILHAWTPSARGMPMTYPSIAAIQAAVCAHFRVTHLDLLSRRRGRAISRPRQVGMWLARHTTPLSLPEIGREFQRDHTTVMHAVDRIDREIAAITPHGAIALQLRTALEQGEAA